MKRYVDYWQLILIKNDNEEYYKVLTETKGGYLNSDRWRLSSPIINVNKVGNTYEFTTYSGATYMCHEKFKRFGILSSSIYRTMKTSSKDHKVRVASVNYFKKNYKPLDNE